MGKNSKDNTSFANAIDYYKSALRVYESKKLHNEIGIVNTSMDKVIRAWKG